MGVQRGRYYGCELCWSQHVLQPYFSQPSCVHSTFVTTPCHHIRSSVVAFDVTRSPREKVVAAHRKTIAFNRRPCYQQPTCFKQLVPRILCKLYLAANPSERTFPISSLSLCNAWFNLYLQSVKHDPIGGQMFICPPRMLSDWKETSIQLRIKVFLLGTRNAGNCSSIVKRMQLLATSPISNRYHNRHQQVTKLHKKYKKVYNLWYGH